MFNRHDIWISWTTFDLDRSNDNLNEFWYLHTHKPHRFHFRADSSAFSVQSIVKLYVFAE